MTTITKPHWWASFASFYNFSAGSGTTIDSNELISRLNTHLVPKPSEYAAHLASTQGNAVPTTSKIDISVLTSGDDFLRANSGSDYISGKAGDDVLYGEAGSDILHGGAGNDLLVGSNEGNPSGDRDTASYLDATSGVTVAMENAATYAVKDGLGSYDILVGIENIIGSDFADTISGHDGNNMLQGGLGDDTIKGGGGNDVIVDGAGADKLFGDAGNDVIIAGLGKDSIALGSGQDRIVIDSSIAKSIGANADTVTDFQTGSGGDKIDLSALLHAVGYEGSNAVGDGYVKISSVSGGTKISVDADGTGSGTSQTVLTLSNVSVGSFSAANNLVTQSKSIIYAPILGQSNAKGLSTAGSDSESGVTRLKKGLDTYFHPDEVVSMVREGGNTGEAIDIAVGGTTVDGNRNTGYPPERVWWYPDNNKPGEVLLRAVDILNNQIADLKARGVVTPFVIWSQGEAETRKLGQSTNPEAAMDRYKEATYDVFDYIKAHVDPSIEFYMMQTGRLSVEGAKNGGLSASGVQQTLKGLDLVHTAQEDMARERADVHLATNYSDLPLLHEADPNQFPTDDWHPEYESREIIGDRLAAFIAADHGLTHVIQNPGPYPVRALTDLHIYPGTGGGAGGSSSTITGTEGDDRLTAPASGGTLIGLGGADKLIATGGDTTIIGGHGKDSITAGSGRDTIVFGADLLSTLSADTDFVTKFKAGDGGDRIDISGMLEAAGYTGSDPVADGYFKLVADGTRTKLYFDVNGPGGTGPKYLATLDGVSVSSFSVAHNLVIKPENSSGTGGEVSNGLNITGTSSPDMIIGTLGKDIIHGGGGKDMIIGGAGADLLSGGASADAFIFEKSAWSEISTHSGSTLAYADVIDDFATGSGGDHLDISILLELAGFHGSDAVGAGYVTVQAHGSDTAILFDKDGSGSSGSLTIAVLNGVSANAFDEHANLVTHYQAALVS